MYKRLINIFLLVACINSVSAQTPGVDTNYYKTYPNSVVARAFFSRKYMSPALQGIEQGNQLSYISNNKFNAGIGATYKIATVNIGVGVGYLNEDGKAKGKTKTLDLLTHIYPRKLIIDLYGQFFKGYSLAPKGRAAANGELYYRRPDIKNQLIGFSAYRLTNPSKFSFRAGFLQNEWQQKSAGTFLLGLEAYLGHLKGDSSLVPSSEADEYSQKNVQRMRFIQFGPGAGYAYTLVLKKHFFLTANVNANGSFQLIKEDGQGFSNDKFAIKPLVTIRALAGYNSAQWAVVLSWVHQNNFLAGTISNDGYFNKTGNYRITFAKRFLPGPGLKKLLKIIDWVPIKVAN